jgi:cobalt-zinc-cadmium efflux system membrane fusion protein
MKFVPTYSWRPAILFFVAAAATLAGCGQKPAPVTEAPGPKVEGDTVTFATNAPQLSSISVETVQPRQLAVTHLTGRLYWDDDLTVRVFTPVAGRVTVVLADLGQRVSAQTPLAEIDSPDFGQALSDTRTAAGNFNAAEKTYRREKELLAHGAAAQKDVETAEAAFVAAQAEKQRAKSRLALYGGSEHGESEVYKLRSPLAGVVVDKSINPGQEVRADQMLANAPNLFAPLFTVSDPSKLWLQIDLAETDLPRLQRGQRLRLSSPVYPARFFDGRVDRIADTLDPATRTVRVRGLVENPDNLLKAEMYVTVDVVQDAADTTSAVEIPSAATFRKDNQDYLFVEDSPGRYTRRHVTLGLEQDGKVPVFAGLEAGRKVVTEGGLLLEALIDPAS